MRKYFINFLGIFLGGIFLVSGFGKLVNINGFVKLIDSYGLHIISFLAPAIAISEITIGILFILYIKLKSTAKYGALMIFIFTVAYLYGFITRGIQDCGCFGSVDYIQSSPIIVLLRNVAILSLLAIVIKYSSNHSLTKWKSAIVVPVILFSIFLSGLTFNKPISLMHKQTSIAIDTIKVKSILIDRFVDTKIINNTYLLYVFSFDCKHCWNSIENVLAYKESEVVDTIISFAYGDAASKEQFERYFGDRIKPIIIPLDTIKLITGFVPIAYIYRDGSIIKQFKGEIPSPFIYINNNQNTGISRKTFK